MEAIMPNLGRQILEDYAASDWLKKAVVSSGDRDVVDSLHDTITLLKVCKERAERAGLPTPAIIV
jgi:hypothetical protein